MHTYTHTRPSRTTHAFIQAHAKNYKSTWLLSETAVAGPGRTDLQKQMENKTEILKGIFSTAPSNGLDRTVMQSTAKIQAKPKAQPHANRATEFMPIPLTLTRTTPSPSPPSLLHPHPHHPFTLTLLHCLAHCRRIVALRSGGSPRHPRDGWRMARMCAATPQTPRAT